MTTRAGCRLLTLGFAALGLFLRASRLIAFAQAAPQNLPPSNAANALPALSLAQSVQIALTNSPQSRAARAAREGAQALADAEKPVARPTLNVTARGTAQGPRATFPRPDGSLATVLPPLFGQVGLTVEQTLYRAGLGAARQRYQAQFALGDVEFRKTQADLALNAAKAYLDVQRAETGAQSAQDGLESARQYEALVERQIAAGTAKPIDAPAARAQTAEAEAGVVAAEGGLTLARLAFNRALGRPLATPVTLEPLSAPPDAPESSEAAIARALENRPELNTLAQNLRAAQAGVALARSQTAPTLSVRGQISEQTPSAFVREHYAAATLEMRWPLLDGGKARNETRQAQAQAERLAALLEDARQGIILDVTQAWQKMRTQAAQLRLAQARRTSAEAANAVAQKALEVGRATPFEARGAQQAVEMARDRERQAALDLQGAAWDFAAVQGALLAELRVNPESKPAPALGIKNELGSENKFTRAKGAAGR